MSIPELPKITPLIAASASGVDEANGGWWRVVKNVWHRAPFLRVLGGALHAIFLFTKLYQIHKKRKNVSVSKCNGLSRIAEMIYMKQLFGMLLLFCTRSC